MTLETEFLAIAPKAVGSRASAAPMPKAYRVTVNGLADVKVVQREVEAGVSRALAKWQERQRRDRMSTMNDLG